MMALLLPQWAPPETLHRLANVRRRQRSRQLARATHGATQSSTSIQASTDHFKIPSTEPCCNLISPLVMTPRKLVRRSSTRLRVRRGSGEDVKTDDTETDFDAAEWYSRVLANNGVVEVDPVTLAEQMRHAKYYQAESNNNNNNTYYHYGSSSEAQDVYPSRSPQGFPARVPLGVALAAGSAVALAVIALLIQALHKESNETDSNSSASEGSNLTSSFKGQPVAPDLPSKVSHQAENSKEVLASSAAAGASLFNFSGRNKTPSPPSLSKDEKSWSESKYASVTPFFASDRSPSYSKPAPPPVSRWQEDKYKSVRPFFPDEAAATETVGPSLSDEQGSRGKNENGSSANRTVTPFFPDEQQGSKNVKGSASLQNAPPFFPDEQQGSKNVMGSASLQNVPPFFPDEQQGSKNVMGSASLQNVPPFFPDEQQGSKNEMGSASLQNVPPFFPDEQQGSKNVMGSASLQNVPSFFPDEQQSKNGPSLESVAPFFPDEQQGRNSTGVSQSVGKVKVENVKPFFPDEHVGTASGSGSSKQSSGGFKWSQFWDGKSKKGDSSAVSTQTVDSRGPAPVKSSESLQSEGRQFLEEIAGKPQGQHKEFVKGTTEERLTPNTSGAFSFQGDKKAPEVARALSSYELALLEDIQAEEERRFAKMQALQAAFPALAIGAGAVGALVGVDGAFEMVGVTATASFISYELLWANKRKELVDEISRITDHHKLFTFLQKRKIVKDDC